MLPFRWAWNALLCPPQPEGDDMPCLTQDEKDDIAVALLEVTERFGGGAPIDIPLIHRQAAEV